MLTSKLYTALMLHYCYGISNHWLLACVSNSLFKRRAKTLQRFSLLARYEGSIFYLCFTCGFPTKKSGNAESASVSWPLRWRHNERDGVSNHQPHDCLLNRLFGRKSKWTSKFRVTGLCVGNSPGTGEFPAQMASNAENVSIWWRHHDAIMKVERPCLWSRKYCAFGLTKMLHIELMYMTSTNSNWKQTFFRSFVHILIRCGIGLTSMI